MKLNSFHQRRQSAGHARPIGIASPKRLLTGMAFGVALLSALGVANPARAAGPQATVASYHAGLLNVMMQAKQLGYAGRAQKLAPLIRRAFDLPYLSRRIIGSKAWRALTAAQRNAYVRAFSRLTVATYASRFKGFSGEKFVTSGTEKIGAKYVLVRTNVVKSNGGKVALNYLMQQRGGAWKVIDVYLKGAVSEVATRRSEFRAVLRDKGANGLIRAIEGKIAVVRRGA